MYKYDSINKSIEITSKDIINSKEYDNTKLAMAGLLISNNQPKSFGGSNYFTLNLFNKGIEFHYIEFMNTGVGTSSTMATGFKYHMASGAGLPGYLVGAAITGAASLVKDKINNKDKETQISETIYIPYVEENTLIPNRYGLVNILNVALNGKFSDSDIINSNEFTNCLCIVALPQICRAL